jgi:hypothetical protein
MACILIHICAAAYAQDRGPYLIPRTVYVGDRATLVIPLAAAGNAEMVLDAKNLPLSMDIDFHRIVLERRPSGSRLLVEFSAFTPGLLELPPIEIGGERFAGLRVEINSIISADKDGAVLSGPASPLAIPGTSFLVYGTMGALVLILLLALWLGIWGRRHLGGWILRWKRRRLIVSMWGIEKRLRKELVREGKRRDILNALSGEFRSFLSFFTGENCRAMTAAEFSNIPPELLIQGNLEESSAGTDAGDSAKKASPGPLPELVNGDFLGTFFRRCDELRFSGSEIAAGDVLAMLGDLRDFLKNLERTEGTFRPMGEAA